MTSHPHQSPRVFHDLFRADEIGALAWRPEDSVERDGWLFRSAHGFTRRANSATPVATARMPIVDAVDWVADEARSRGQIARFQLSDHLLHDAERRWLTEMGIGGIDSTLVMVARQALDRFDPAVDVADRVDAPWHNRWHDVSGASVAPQISAGFMAGLGGVKAASVGPIDRPSCVGLGLETELGSYLCAIATDPSLRGRGMATRLVAHLMTIMPAPFVLNVVPSNPAVRIYERLGFSAVHSYRYHELG